MRAALLAASCCVASVAAHGEIVSPPVRQVGPAMEASCGADAVAAVTADSGMPLEDLINMTRSAPACKLDLCRGAEFQDNVANVQKFSAGQVVKFEAELPIPHEGPCNVSVVDTRTNTVIGQPLIEFDTYADEKLAEMPANNTNFEVKMPQLPAGQCTKPGECVMQWWWLGSDVAQSYESCVDFVAVPPAAAPAAAPAMKDSAQGSVNGCAPPAKVSTKGLGPQTTSTRARPTSSVQKASTSKQTSSPQRERTGTAGQGSKQSNGQ